MQEDTAYVYKITFYQKFEMEQKGMTFDHDFYVVVGKQCRTEKTYALYKSTNALLLLICFKLVMKSMKLC